MAAAGVGASRPLHCGAMPTPTSVRSFSKINLGLRIGPPRADGFHELTTLFQTVALHDVVTVEAQSASATRIELTSSDPRIPCDARNTAWRITQAALELLGVQAHVRLHLQKSLPPQGGMGAGSANAAAALLGLEAQLGVALPALQRQKLAASIGSDVPVFLVGGTVYAHNRGELCVPYPDLPRMHCVVVAPSVGSSTPAAFRAWDQHITRLTPQAARDRLSELSRIYASAFTAAGTMFSGGRLPAGVIRGYRPGYRPADDQIGASGVLEHLAEGLPSQPQDLAGNPLLALVRTGIENDFEEVVFQQHPSLREIKHALLGRDSRDESRLTEPSGSALLAMLSGSGSSLFGLYRSEADAMAAQQRVLVLGTGARVFLTHTVSRDEYWKSMVLPG